MNICFVHSIFSSQSVNIMKCNQCTRSFARKQDLNRHLNERRKSRCKSMHYYGKCNKGLSSANALWRHMKRCSTEPDDQIFTLNDLVNGQLTDSSPGSKGSDEKVFSLNALSRCVDQWLV